MKTILVDDMDILGSGGFAIVFSGQLVDNAISPNKRSRTNVSINYDALENSGEDTCLQVAVKRIQLAHTVTECDREGKALRQLDHPNVVKLLHVESDTKFRYYALELCSASLDQLFLKDGHKKKYNGPPLPPHLTVLFQLALGLKYIHSKNLTHRDIKPHNVLIHVVEIAGGQPVVTMKWADFGLSKTVNLRGTFTMSGIRGTLCWMAPEVLNVIADEEEGANGESVSEEPSAPRGTIKSDVFAAGCVFVYYLLDGVHLFGCNQMEIPNNIRNNQPINLERLSSSSQHSYTLGYFIADMLMVNPETRIASADVVQRISSLF